MAHRISVSQFQSKIRDLQRQQRQAIGRYNQGIRRLNQAIDQHNRDVRARNARVRANRQRLQSALSRLAHQPVPTRYIVFRSSVEAVRTAYVRFEQRLETHPDPRYGQILELSERDREQLGRDERPARQRAGTG